METFWLHILFSRLKYVTSADVMCELEENSWPMDSNSPKNSVTMSSWIPEKLFELYGFPGAETEY